MPVLPTANDIDKHVGLRMRRRREALGISQGRLGRHLGLTFSQIQKYEKGSNRIGAGRLYQIAAFLGVPPSHFFDGIDSPAAPGGATPLATTPAGAPGLSMPSKKWLGGMPRKVAIW